MNDIMIKVVPSVLEGVCDDVITKVQKTQRAFEEMEKTIKSTAEYWEGSGQQSMHQAYAVRCDDYERVFVALEEHVNHLLQIAGIYKLGERDAIRYSQELPADIIM